MKPSLKRYAWLSIAAAVSTILLKGLAWHLTGSVGLLSDAIESFVNLAGALMALGMLTLAERPEDARHAYGHGKAEYFSSAFEGFLILAAALAIGHAAIGRFVAPQPLSGVRAGLVVSVAASAINLAAARVLMAAGRAHRSITLEADAHHLMTDVWTSAGVLAGVGLASLTGWLWLDPAVALLVAANIVATGWMLLRRSAAGLMDVALPAGQLRAIDEVLARHRADGLDFHALRTRQAGSRVFVALHVLVPGDWSVKRAHDRSERIERELRDALPHAHVTTHLEPLGDPLSMADQALDRDERRAD